MNHRNITKSAALYTKTIENASIILLISIKQRQNEQQQLLYKNSGLPLVAGLTLSALWLSIGNGGNIPWLPPVFIFAGVGLSLVASIIYPIIWQLQENKNPIDADIRFGLLYALIRYSVAFNLARFGWAKLLGLQFIVPASIAAQPINQLSGEWLTWYYFGHSFTFGLIVAIIQIGGSFLLLFRRTLLARAHHPFCHSC